MKPLAYCELVSTRLRVCVCARACVCVRERSHVLFFIYSLNINYNPKNYIYNNIMKFNIQMKIMSLFFSDLTFHGWISFQIERRILVHFSDLLVLGCLG